jgi:hypothetical protein
MNVLNQHVLKKQIIDNLKDCDKMPLEALNIIKKTVDKQRNKILKIKSIKPIIIQNNKLDITSVKYILLLKLVNLILNNLKRPLIADLREFKNIDRIDIVNPIHLEGFNQLLKEIIKTFNKKNYGLTNKSPNIVYLYIKYMCKEIGLKIITNCYNKQIKTISRTHYLYSIT